LFAEPDICMRQQSDHYEYIGVYVDDLAITSKNPNDVIQTLEKNYKLNVKGVGPLKLHLGCHFNHVEDGILLY
jgi:hypothetical protein